MRFLLWGVVIMAAVSCQTGQVVTSTPGPCGDIERFFQTTLTKYQDELDEIGRLYQIEQWKVETADPTASQEKLSKYFSDLQKASYRKDVLDATRKIAEETKSLQGCAWQPKLVRALGMLQAGMLTDPKVIQKEKDNQDLQDKLGEKSNAFRMTVEGEKEPISRAIYSKKLGSLEDRAGREKLFRAHNPARAQLWLKEGFRELIKSRNEEARLAGFKDFYEYRFFRNQLDLKNYRAQVIDMRKRLAPQIRAAVKEMGKSAGVAKVKIWDLRYVREKSAAGEINELLENLQPDAVMDMAKKFYSELGINIDSYNFMKDLYPRAGKNTHAFAMAVVMPHVDKEGKLLASPSADIRFLANLKQPVKWDDISTVIHELGHAVHAGEVRQPIAAFRGIGSVETEAFAMLLERMAETPEFMMDVLPAASNRPLAEIKPMLERQVMATRLEQAVVLLRQVYFSDFEYEMYQDPDADFGKLWSKMHKEYWGVEVAPELADWDTEHYLSSPVYVQNYAIGMTMVEQFYQAIIKEFMTSYRSHDLGNKVRSVLFNPGVEFNYLQFTQKFTGKPLSADAALKGIPKKLPKRRQISKTR